MLMRRYCLFFMPLILLLVGSIGSAEAQKHYRDLEFPALNDIETPVPTRVVLDNGITLFLVEDHRLPIINLSARVGVGSVNEPADKIGLAGITGAVMRTGGSASMTGDEIDETLESIGASVETSIGRVSGSASMNVLKENVDVALPILADVLMNPAFPEEKIELEKVEARSTIARRNDDPTDMGFREFSKLIYGEESVYARHSEYATIDAIARDDLVDFHHAWFHPENVIMGVWGDFETEDMAAKIADAFSQWEKSGFQRPDLPGVDYTFDRSVHFVKKDDINQSTVVLGHLGGLMDNPDYFALQVMNDILSGGFSGRLFRNVRSEQGLAYAVFGIYSANYAYPGIFYVGCMTKSESTIQAVRSLLHEVERMKTDDITEEELNLAKESFLNSFVFNFDTRGEIIGRQMTYEYYGFPTDFLEKTKTEVEQVTVEDVQRVARKYLQPDKVRILVVGNDSDFDEPVSTLGAVHEIDVTIAAPGMETPEASEDDLATGAALLDRSAEALGGKAAFSAIQSISSKRSVSVITPQGEMEIDAETLIDLSGNVRSIMQTPMGEMQQLLIGDQAWMVGVMGSRPLQAPMRDEMIGNLWQTLVYLYGHMDAEGLTAQHLGQENIDGQAVEALLITPPGLNPFRLYLDADTMVPVKKAAQAMTQQGPMETESMLSDYREVEGGIKLPFKETMTRNGEPGGEAVIQSIEINPEIPEGLLCRLNSSAA